MILVGGLVVHGLTVFEGLQIRRRDGGAVSEVGVGESEAALGFGEDVGGEIFEGEHGERTRNRGN